MRRHYRKLLKSGTAQRYAVIRSRTLSDTIQHIGALTILWSVLSFVFATGFYFRIDPSTFYLFTVSDALALSNSYAIYLIPMLILGVSSAIQLTIPHPENKTNQTMAEAAAKFIWHHVGSSRRLLVLIAPLPILPYAFDYIDRWYHPLDRSSLFYRMGFLYDSLLCVLSLTFLYQFIQPKVKLLAKGISAFVLVIFIFLFVYSIGDYAASIRMNHPETLDCAALDKEDSCRPILIWGSSYFIS